MSETIIDKTAQRGGVIPDSAYLTLITDKWMYFPCHEGSGALLSDVGAAYNNGGVTPLVTGGGLTITDQGTQDPWTTYGVFTPDSLSSNQVYAVQRNNQELMDFLNLDSLNGIGSMMMSARITMKSVPIVTTSAAASTAMVNSVTGGYGIGFSTAEKFAVLWRAPGAGSAITMVVGPLQTGAVSANICVFFDVLNSGVYAYLNGGSESFTGQSAWPIPSATEGFAIGGAPYAGSMGYIGNQLEVSDLLMVRFERDVSAKFSAIAKALHDNGSRLPARSIAAI